MHCECRSCEAVRATCRAVESVFWAVVMLAGAWGMMWTATRVLYPVVRPYLVAVFS